MSASPINFNYVGVAILCAGSFYLGSLHEASRIQHQCEDIRYPVVIGESTFVCETADVALHRRD